MPEITIKKPRSTGLTFLSDVPPGEIWEELDGAAVFHDGCGKGMFVGETGSIQVYGLMAPSEIKVLRKLSDPIRVIFET